MVLVDHDVTDREIGERRQCGAALVFRPAKQAPAGAEDLRLGEDDHAEGRDREPGGEVADHDGERRVPVECRRGEDLELVLAQDLAQVLDLALVGRDEADPEPFAPPPHELTRELPEPAAELRNRLRLERELHGLRQRPRGRARCAGHERELDELAPREPLAQGRARRRVLAGRVEHARHVDDDRRRSRHVVGKPRRRSLALGHEGQGEELVERGAGALGGRIEEADRLDLVAEELEPRRARVARREDIDDAAAEAPLPDRDDGVCALVAGVLERLEQELTVERVAHGEP